MQGRKKERGGERKKGEGKTKELEEMGKMQQLSQKEVFFKNLANFCMLIFHQFEI